MLIPFPAWDVRTSENRQLLTYDPPLTPCNPHTKSVEHRAQHHFTPISLADSFHEDREQVFNMEDDNRKKAQTREL